MVGLGRKGGIVPRVISPTRNQAWQIMPRSKPLNKQKRFHVTLMYRKKSHTIEGHLVTIAKAEPEPEPPGEEEEDLPEPEEDEHGMTMIKKMKMSLEGVLDADQGSGEAFTVKAC